MRGVKAATKTSKVMVNTTGVVSSVQNGSSYAKSSLVGLGSVISKGANFYSNMKTGVAYNDDDLRLVLSTTRDMLDTLLAKPQNLDNLDDYAKTNAVLASLILLQGTGSRHACQAGGRGGNDTPTRSWWSNFWAVHFSERFECGKP